MREGSLAFPLTRDELSALVSASLPRELETAARTSSEQGSVLAIGAFDGVHRGHRQLIDTCVQRAHDIGARSVVVTFDPDPSELLLGPQPGGRLLATVDRVRLCRSLGVDDVFVVPFTHELAAQSPHAFMTYLHDVLGDIVGVCVGENFHFGHRGEGDVSTLAALGAEMGFEVLVQPLLQLADGVVSSTRVRALLGAGKVAEAAELLGRHHFVRGVVAHGRGEGTSFGFPTANVVCDAQACVPAAGVYACVVTDGSRAWPAAANVGMPPTFTQEHSAAFLEANLLGFSGDLYGRELRVIFVEWLRASRPFDSLEELERVVLGNIAWVRDNLGSAEVEVVA